MMIGRDEDKIIALQVNATVGEEIAKEDLPFCVELWQADEDKVERVLARALSVQLARAIFTAALTEFPQRRITLRRGSETVLDSDK
jgi:hypothetical protein